MIFLLVSKLVGEAGNYRRQKGGLTAFISSSKSARALAFAASAISLTACASSLSARWRSLFRRFSCLWGRLASFFCLSRALRSGFHLAARWTFAFRACLASDFAWRFSLRASARATRCSCCLVSLASMDWLIYRVAREICDGPEYIYLPLASASLRS